MIAAVVQETGEVVSLTPRMVDDLNFRSKLS